MPGGSNGRSVSATGSGFCSSKTRPRINWRRPSRSGAGRIDDASALGELQLEAAPRSFADVDRRRARGARSGRSCAGGNMVGAGQPLGARSAGAGFPRLRDAYRSGRMAKRGRFLKTCCSVFRTLSTVGARSAKALHKVGQPKTAVLAFARAAESSADPMDYARLGAALQAINRPREAIVAFRRALEAAPDLVEARMALGSCLRQTGELQMARVELERAVTVLPNDGRAWFVLGLVCEDLRDTSGAIRGLSAQHRGAAGHS